MQLHAILENAVTEAAAVVRGVGPDQLEAPTPCREWDVRALTNHLRLVTGALTLAGRGEPVPDQHWSGSAPADGFDGEAAIAAWARPAAWAGTVRLGAMAMPAPMVASMLVSDLVIHGWDLARAT